MIVASPTSAFGLAPIQSGGPWKPSPVVTPGAGSSGIAQSIIDDAKSKVAAFKVAVNELIASPQRIASARVQLETARLQVDDAITGGVRSTTLAKLDRMLSENASLSTKVNAAADLAEAGRAKVQELAAALGGIGFGVAPLAIAAIIAALAGVTWGIAKLVDSVTVHAVQAKAESDKVQAVIAGQLPVSALQQPTEPGGGSAAPLGFDLKSLAPLLIALAVIPALLSRR